MTKGILFLGVPHGGTDAIYMPWCLSCMAFFHGPLSRTLAVMSLDESALSDLESEFYDTYVIHPEPHDHKLYTCDIFAMRPGKMENPVLGSVSFLSHFLSFQKYSKLFMKLGRRIKTQETPSHPPCWSRY
jgi:hypothetical protein